MHKWPAHSREAAAHEPLCMWLREGGLSSDEWVTHELPLGRVAEGVELAKGSATLKVLIYPDNAAPLASRD